MADRLWFEPTNEFNFEAIQYLQLDGGECSYEDRRCELDSRPNFTMSAQDWLDLNALANQANLTILFDLNCLIRYQNGSWNSKNAELLIQFSDEHAFDVIWQLGNEPNSFQHVFNYKVNSSELAKDFYALKKILSKYPRYKNALLVGPDTTRPQPKHRASEYYLRGFLANAGSLVDAVTWHQYYFNGRFACARDFLDPGVFDILIEQIDIVKNITSESEIPSKPIWLTETSSAYGGGAPGYSNRFIATFIWLDKLGLAARGGIDLVIRQSFYKGYYALVDDELFPRPDWWVSVIYKKLVGPQVVSCKIKSSPYVRLYCHRAKELDFDSIGEACRVGEQLCLFGLNMMANDVKVNVKGLKNNTEAFAYVLTGKNTMFSKYTELNGKELHLLGNSNLPELSPEEIDLRSSLTMPARSIVFWKFKSH